jgi:NAD dependent epimerase/dehydratase family enzyme
MLLPFKMGAGGRLGGGGQYLSWVDHDDLIGMIHHALVRPEVQGALNGTAPHPVTNGTFTTTLGRVLNRPTVIPLPGLAIRALFGEKGRALLLQGARVLPDAAEKSGFTFDFPALEDSLRFQLGRPA